MAIDLRNRYADVGSFAENGVEVLRRLFRAAQATTTYVPKPNCWLTGRAEYGWYSFYNQLLLRSARCRHDYRGAVLCGSPNLSDVELQAAVKQIKSAYAKKERRRQKRVRRAKTGRR